MKRILSLAIAAILLTSCAVAPKQADKQNVDQPSKSEPRIVLQNELLNEPPENPRFVIAQPSVVNVAEQALTESIRQQLLRLGYVEAQSRDDANVVVWYSYDSKQTGMRQVGQGRDAWGEQLAPVAVSDPVAIIPLAFKVQIISLKSEAKRS